MVACPRPAVRAGQERLSLFDHEGRGRRQAEAAPSATRAGKSRTPRRKSRSGARVGSSSPSPVPPYQSTVTPLGTAPRIIETEPMRHAGLARHDRAGRAHHDRRPGDDAAAPGRAEFPGPRGQLRACRQRRGRAAGADRHLYPKLRQSIADAFLLGSWQRIRHHETVMARSVRPPSTGSTSRFWPRSSATAA